MRTLRARKGFTMVELIIVIVILGILASIAIVGYQAVIANARQNSVNTAAQSFDREYRALKAFSSGQTAQDSNGAVVIEVAGDTPADLDLLTNAGTGTAGVDPRGAAVGAAGTDVLAGATVVQVTQDGRSACLTLSSDYAAPGTVAEGNCTF